MPPEMIVAGAPELARVFADRMASAAGRVQANGRALSIVLPGGSVASAFLPVLAQTPIDWSAVEVFWGDERAVPPTHSDSNYRLADELLLGRVAIDRARVHRMPAERSSLEDAARAYEAEIVRVLGEAPRFDVVLLGVGPDGHVCSLFPAHPALAENSRLVVAVTDAPKPPPVRLTMTLAALAGAEIHVAAFGAAKAEAVRDALLTPDSSLPVAQAARAAHAVVFLLDRDAAGLL